MFDLIKDSSLETVSALLAFFYELPVVGGSYGLAIIMLTLSVMVVLMPLTLKATRSTIRMTQLQPEMKALQKKYKDDRQTLNQEMMALYQKHGVNPVGGCLPMIAQLPVFLLLFNVLRGLSRRVWDLPYFAISQQAQELASGVEASSGVGRSFDPRYLNHKSELYADLARETEIGFGPFDLSARTWDVVQGSPLSAFPYLLLIVFVVGSSYYQQRQISARRGAVPDNPTPQQQTQQQLLRILPLMSGIWSFLFPTGLVLYWATSNLFRIGQQSYITRALYSEDGDGTKALSMAAAAADDDDGDDLDDEGDAVATAGDGSGVGGRASNGSGSGRRGSKSGSQVGGSNGSGAPKGELANGSTAEDRNAAWARRRAARAASKPKRPSGSSKSAKSSNSTKSSGKSSGSGAGGSRVTPKGTKPTGGRKKRKR